MENVLETVPNSTVFCVFQNQKKSNSKMDIKRSNLHFVLACFQRFLFHQRSFARRSVRNKTLIGALNQTLLYSQKQNKFFILSFLISPFPQSIQELIASAHCLKLQQSANLIQRQTKTKTKTRNPRKPKTTTKTKNSTTKENKSSRPCLHWSRLCQR